jgi:ferric-dicitrate binding protein FerR (iron transport regulator)
MKQLIAGGNMATDNVMQIRVMPPPTVNASIAPGIAPRFIRTSYGEPQTAPSGEGSGTSLTALMEGMLGYSQGRSAQALGQVPVVSQSAPPSTPAGQVKEIQGNVSVIRAGATTPVPLQLGDTINQNDTIETGADARAFIQFNDNTQITLGESTRLKIDDYVYEPNGTSNSASYRFLEGAFQYIGGLLDKKDPVNINTPVDGIGIRGTEFVVKSDGTPNNLEIDLISGAIALTPTGSAAAGPTMSAPAQIEVTPQGMQMRPLTQDQYNSIKAQLTPRPPIS